MTSRNPMLEGVSKSTPWTCKRCGHVNKGHVTECGQCAHEPVAGRRDHEAKRWDESHHQEDV